MWCSECSQGIRPAIELTQSLTWHSHYPGPDMHIHSAASHYPLITPQCPAVKQDISEQSCRDSKSFVVPDQSADRTEPKCTSRSGAGVLFPLPHCRLAEGHNSRPFLSFHCPLSLSVDCCLCFINSLKFTSVLLTSSHSLTV